MILILDLDDTLFSTKSIKPDIFSPAVHLIESHYKKTAQEAKLQQIIPDLWSFPFDQVAQKHQIPNAVQQAFVNQINALPYSLDISLYPDYPALKDLDYEKVLVTTGFPKLQAAKIEALGIRNDFSAVYIDNPFAQNRQHKQGIFQHLLASKGHTPAHFVVIGDNPASEIKAGKTLGMHTVQRQKTGIPLSELSDHSIASFTEMKMLLASLH